MIGITKLVFFIAFFKFIQSNYIQNTNIFPPYSECSNDGFIYAENFKCYKVFQRIQKLEDAVSICESHNSTVASLHSFLDKYYFINFLNKFNLRNEKIIIMSGYKCIDKHVCNWFDLSKFASLSSFPKCGNNKSPCFGFLINNLSTWACLSENEYYKGNNIGFVCEKNDNALKECKNSKYRRHGDGHCYRKILENQTFTSKVAQSLCEDDDANLPIIKNDIENMVINELSDNTGIHLGLECVLNENEKSYNCSWLDGTKAVYNGLKDDNLNNTCFAIENDYYWKSRNCKIPRKVVCQIRNELADSNKVFEFVAEDVNTDITESYDSPLIASESKNTNSSDNENTNSVDNVNVTRDNEKLNNIEESNDELKEDLISIAAFIEKPSEDSEKKQLDLIIEQQPWAKTDLVKLPKYL